MGQNVLQINSYLQRISNILLINGGFLSNPGLYTGETGLVLFFFHYANYTGKKMYRDYSFELLEKIQNRINQETPINYKEGLAGIGSAIEYLVQGGFIEGITDEILEEFDERIFDIRNIPKLSIEDIDGILYYAFWRIYGSRSKRKYLLNTQLLPIVNAVEEWRSTHITTHPFFDSFKVLVKSEANISMIDDKPVIFPSWNRLTCKNNPNISTLTGPSPRFLEIMSGNDIFSPYNTELGLLNGLAGMGMTLLTEIDDDTGIIKWTSLLQNEITPERNESIPV